MNVTLLLRGGFYHIFAPWFDSVLTFIRTFTSSNTSLMRTKFTKGRKKGEKILNICPANVLEHIQG